MLPVGPVRLLANEIVLEPPAAKANEISAARLPGPLAASLVTRKPGAAAGETEIELLVPEIVADESVAVMVCVPAVLSVAVSVALPLVNDMLPKLRRPDYRRASPHR